CLPSRTLFIHTEQAAFRILDSESPQHAPNGEFRVIEVVPKTEGGAVVEALEEPLPEAAPIEKAPQLAPRIHLVHRGKGVFLLTCPKPLLEGKMQMKRRRLRENGDRRPAIDGVDDHHGAGPEQSL